MAKGKFSQPRNNFTTEDNVSRILQEYQPSKAPVQPAPQVAPVPKDIQEDMAIEQAFHEVSETDEEADHDLPVFLENLLSFVSRNRKTVLVSACSIVLILLISIICIFLFGTASDPYEGRILNNVVVAGVNVGGMTRAEAEDAVRAVTANTYTNN